MGMCVCVNCDYCGNFIVCPKCGSENIDYDEFYNFCKDDDIEEIEQYEE